MSAPTPHTGPGCTCSPTARVTDGQCHLCPEPNDAPPAPTGPEPEEQLVLLDDLVAEPIWDRAFRERDAALAHVSALQADVAEVRENARVDFESGRQAVVQAQQLWRTAVEERDEARAQARRMRQLTDGLLAQLVAQGEVVEKAAAHVAYFRSMGARPESPFTAETAAALITAVDQMGARAATVSAESIDPPEEIYGILAADQASRWGYGLSLDPEALTEYLRIRSEDKNVRADVDAVWLAAMTHYRLPPFPARRDAPDGPMLPDVLTDRIAATDTCTCPHRTRCPSCRCVLDFQHAGDHDVHCGNGNRP